MMCCFAGLPLKDSRSGEANSARRMVSSRSISFHSFWWQNNAKMARWRHVSIGVNGIIDPAGLGWGKMGDYMVAEEINIETATGLAPQCTAKHINIKRLGPVEIVNRYGQMKKRFHVRSFYTWATFSKGSDRPSGRLS